VNILVFNPGSATLKFGLYRMPDAESGSDATDAPAVLASGSIEPIGTPHARLSIAAAGQEPVSETVEAQTPVQAVEQTLRRLRAEGGENTRAAMTIDAVGCRVVHGGARFVEPARVSAALLDELRALRDLAPLHNPVDVAVLEQLKRLLPETSVVAVFDTAFHRTLPPLAYSYALPAELCARYGLRRYGFHGISHAYVSRRLFQHLGGDARGTKLVTCHLGSGASICALRDGQSVDTSMGFTPLEGLVMGTRSGDIDPTVVSYLVRHEGVEAEVVERWLNERSGLLGISGRSRDMSALLTAADQADDERAALAIDVFCYRGRKYLGGYLAALGGADAVIFGGGIGENVPRVRAGVCENMQWCGLTIDKERNAQAVGLKAGGVARISPDDARLPAYVIPADEESWIARETARCVLAENA
jgi:acetate kinase